MLLDAGLEALLVVVVEDVVTQPQQALHHRVGFLHEFDDALRRHTDEPAQHIVQRHVIADGEVVNEREALSAFGRIAAGVAHEVKNPLGGIRGAAELLAARASDGKTIDFIIGAVGKAIT